MPAPPLRPGETVRIRGQRWSITAPAGPILHVRGCDTGNRHAVASFLVTVEQIERLPPPAIRIVRPSRWQHEVRAMLADAGAPDTLIAAAATRIDVLPYQLEPALAIIRGFGVRLLIADEVGLGKTIEAGLIVAELLARSPDSRVLVLTPAGLREQWQAELKRRFGIEAALIDAGTLAAATTGSLAGANPWVIAGPGIASIDFVKRPEVIRSLETIVWDLVVLDEAHGLTGRSDRGDAARLIAERARTLVMLTATPHPGDDAAFERLAEVGNIEQRFPLVVFRRTRHDAGLAAERRTTWLRVRPGPAERAMHDALMDYAGTVWTDRGVSQPAARLAMTVLVKRACSSAASLAQSLDRRLALLGSVAPALSQPLLPFADDPDDGVLAVPGMRDAAGEQRLLEQLRRLAIAASLGETKPARLIRLLRRASQPAIVFTEYRDTLATLAGALSSLTPVLLHGALTTAERREAVDAFTRGRANLLLATDAASEGLNLHARCRLVVNLELPWTPTRLEQRIGRVERIGQQRRVHAVHLVAAGTAEESTVERLVGRLRLVARAVESFRAPPLREHDVAAAMFGHASAEKPGPPPSRTAPRLHIPDLRDAGIAEAGRIVRLRALVPAAPADRADLKVRLDGSRRPIVTRRPRRGLPFAACCIYRFVLTDSSQEFVAECLAALAVEVVAAGGPADLRRRLADIEHLLLPTVVGAYLDVGAAFTARRAAFIESAIDREGAILRTLEGRQSRLAVGLLQPGLFDRRAERAAGAQRAVLREAADHCRERERTLRRVAAPVTSGHWLLCAIVTD